MVVVGSAVGLLIMMGAVFSFYLGYRFGRWTAKQ